MATPKNTLYNWFLTGLKPKQAQFWAWLDSFWHKNESIPVASITNLQGLLDDKLDASALPIIRPTITVNGNLFFLVKNPNNNNPENAKILETNDFICDGAWDANEWWDKAIALGTDIDNKSNWKPLGAVKEIPLI